MSTDLVVVEEPKQKFPDMATAIVCQYFDEFIIGKQFVQLSDFKTSLSEHIKAIVDKRDVVYRLLYCNFKNVDWDFVDTYVKEHNNVQA